VAGRWEKVMMLRSYARPNREKSHSGPGGSQREITPKSGAETVQLWDYSSLKSLG